MKWFYLELLIENHVTEHDKIFLNFAREEKFPKRYESLQNPLNVKIPFI